MNIDYVRPWFWWYPIKASISCLIRTASSSVSYDPRPIVTRHLPVRLSLCTPDVPEVLLVCRFRFRAFSAIETRRKLDQRLSARLPLMWSICFGGGAPVISSQMTRWASRIFPLMLPHLYPRFITVLHAGFPAQREFQERQRASAGTAPLSENISGVRGFHSNSPVAWLYSKISRYNFLTPLTV